jgi:16S rRNA (uracil1498-N3)-methyltransferase
LFFAANGLNFIFHSCMHRFYAEPELCTGPDFVLEGREAHHALHVLRVRQGERVIVLNGAGGEWVCEVGGCHRDRLQLVVVQKNLVPPLSWRVTLLQALPKGKIIESIVQKATELGVHRIVPLVTERTAVRLEEATASLKTAKWQTIAIEAAKQCGSAWLPHIEAPVTPEKYLAHLPEFELSLVGSLQPGSRHAGEYFDAFREKQKRPPQSIAVWVGPEGDFTPEELASIIASGAGPITLGRLVLRSETAAIYCVSIINHELQSTT